MPFQSDSFDRRLGVNNNPLTELEAKYVKARLKLRLNELDKIDDVLNQSGSQLPSPATLLGDRMKILTVIDRYRISLSPFKKLPIELIQLIFRYVSMGYDHLVPSIDNPPLLLCRVSSSWRRAALSMPELWKTLHLLNAKKLDRFQKVIAAKMWFSRAGNMKLTLSLSETDFSKPCVDFIREIIVPFSRNFKSLYLVLGHSQVFDFFALPPGSLDNLENLYTVVYRDPGDKIFVSEVPIIIGVFNSSSRLRRLRVDLYSSITFLPFALLPMWHSLETFRCDSALDAEGCHTLLASCRALKSIHVRIYGIRFSLDSDVTQIFLPNLLSLSIHLCDQEAYDRFFLPLILPALKSLSIFSYDGNFWSPGMYSALLERSGCPLEQLYLGTLDAQPAQVLPLLQKTPTLRSLTLSHNTRPSIETFDKIGSGLIGGCLESLFLKGSSSLEPVLAMLEALLKSTRPGQPPHLTFVEMHGTKEDEAPYADRIEALRSHGIELSLLPEPDNYFRL